MELPAIPDQPSPPPAEAPGAHGATGPAGSGPDGPEGSDEILRGLWTSLEELRHTVENDHDHRLRRIESDLRWLTILLGAEIVALISASIATIATGG